VIADFEKCISCSRIDTLAKSGNTDTKMDTDSWLSDETVSFVVSDIAKPAKKE